MVRKYAHFSTTHLTEYVDRGSSVPLVAPMDVATVGLQSEDEKGAALLQPFQDLARQRG